MKQESSFQKILGYAGDKKGNIYISAILSAISALLALIPYYYFWRIVHGIIFEDIGTNLKHYGWNAFIWVVISSVMYIAALFFSYKVSVTVSANIRKRLIHHVAELPYDNVQSFGTGKLRKVIMESSDTIERYVSHQFPDKACTMATPVGVLVMLFAFDYKLGLLSIISLILGIVLLVCFMGKGLAKVMKDYQKSLDQMSNDVGEYVRDIAVVKIFGQSIISFRKLKSSIDNYENMVTAYIKRMELPMVAYSVAIYSTFVFLTIGGISMADKGMSASTLSNYIFYVVFTPAIVLMMNRFMYQSKSAIYVKDAFERMDTVLNLKAMDRGSESKEPTSFDISLENVCFSYDKKHNAVKNIFLQVKEGSKVAFVGSSGSGKTTVANLIGRLYQPDQGSIRIGGMDILSIQKEKLRKLISYVYQDNHLIKASILENVKMANVNASREEVIRALEASRCMDIVNKFPDGVNTIIGTKGIHLSGGEVQRLAIARCFLKDSPIIILDEATAYADPDNERKIQEALSVLAKGKTVIMIAHRLSTVKDADQIFVFSDGTIIENGTTEQLMQKNGCYRAMWEQYTKSSVWKIERTPLKGDAS